MQRVEKIVSGGQIDDSYPNVITPLNHLLDNSMSSFEQTQRFDNDIRRFMRQWGIKGGSFALMHKDS
ncbi:MAG: hypothetical protein RR770_05350, partial [Bacteroidales bacterium]